MGFFEKDIPKQARTYMAVVILAGAMVLSYCAYFSVSHVDLRWLYLAGFTACGSVLSVRLPSFRGRFQSTIVSISDIFIFTAILVFGPEVAVVVAAIDSIVGGAVAHGTKKANRLFFNTAQLTVATYVVGQFFYWLQGSPPPLSPSTVEISRLLTQLGFCALLYFVFNTFAVAKAISLTTGKEFTEIWRQNFLWLSLPTFAGASGAAIIFIYFEAMPFFGVAVAAPIVLIIHYAYKTNLQRIKQAQAHLDTMQELYHSTIASLAMAIDAKDAKTHGHIERVQRVCLRVAQYAGMTDENDLEGLKAASLLHDIGKLAIPEHILNKPSALTPGELKIVRKHPTIGADILKSVPFPYPVVPFVRYHHEKWDGSGYPEGLRAEEIPLGARVLSIADCYDALRSDRPYRPALTRENAIEHIRTESGKAYDPQIVDTFLEHIDEIEDELQEPEVLEPEDSSTEGLQAEQSPQGQISQTAFFEIASSHQEIQAVYEISGALGTSLKVGETLGLLTEKIFNLVPYTTCAIYLIDSLGERLVPHRVAGLHKEFYEGYSLEVGSGISGWVAAHGQQLINVSPSPDFLGREELRSAYRSCLVVPLTLNDAVLGVISLYSDKADGFTHDHLRFMESISPHAATAIRNAINYEETQETALTDSLTALPNRRYFRMFVDRQLKSAARLEHAVTILMMDLEDFKEVNDHFGHKVGDRILAEVSGLLREHLRASDTLVRYGGDEFVGILPGVNKEQAQNATLRIQETLDDHEFSVDGTAFSVGVSIGAAAYPDDGEESEQLLALADKAMYKDKARRDQRKTGDNIVPFEKGSDKSS